MIFSKIFFGILLARKKLQNAKIKVWQVPLESDNVRSPLPNFRWESLIGSGQNDQIRSYPSRILWIRPDQWQDLVISDRIPAVLARSGKSLLGRNPAIFQSEYGGWIPTSAGYRRPEVVGLRRQLDSNDWQLLNSDNRISNVRVRMKSFISENDLQF